MEAETSTRMSPVPDVQRLKKYLGLNEISQCIFWNQSTKQKQQTDGLDVAVLSQLSAIATSAVYIMLEKKNWCQGMLCGTAGDV